ncbi:type IV secretion system DNA-binding domain-containing protein [Sphingomonas sp. ID1715]|uniref:type IV secretion system DNA-binding domain-containing protein n=1 Tax=Sphingomonas sp. ID1715 TaxID=1656898 RepID=UPI0034A03ADB
MEGSVADPLTAPEAARMAEPIRAVLNANAKAHCMLPTTGTPFSVKRGVAGDSKPGAILFVSARYVDMSVASRLLSQSYSSNNLRTADECPNDVIPQVLATALSCGRKQAVDRRESRRKISVAQIRRVLSFPTC